MYTGFEELLRKAPSQTERYSWLAKLIQPALRRTKLGGQVFVSIPRHCAEQYASIKKHLESELDLDVINYNQGDANSVSAGALERIRGADFFLGVWHHEKDKPLELSPWMPFELGVALALGKPYIIIAHESLPDDIKHRVKPEHSLIVYNDVRLVEIIVHQLIPACRERFPRP